MNKDNPHATISTFSTRLKTALINVSNDLLLVSDAGEYSILMLPGCDTGDLTINRLERKKKGKKKNALAAPTWGRACAITVLEILVQVWLYSLVSVPRFSFALF